MHDGKDSIEYYKHQTKYSTYHKRKRTNIYGDSIDEEQKENTNNRVYDL